MKIKPILLLCLILGGGVAAHAGALLKPTTGATQALRAKSLDVRAEVNGAFAQTTVTTTYANPNNGQIEADFIYTAPDGATVTGFAYWFKGEKVIARVVEKERAADIYRLITVRRRDPALVEMIGKNTFRARIAPVEAGADLKIEVVYAAPLQATRDGWRWSFPLGEETKNYPLDAVNFRATLANGAQATSNFGEFAGGELSAQKKTVKDAADIRLDVAAPRAPLKVSLFAARDGGGDGFFAIALAPDFSATKPNFAISGVQTYDVMRDENARAGQTFVAVGRYRGAGAALVKLGKRSVNVRFDDARKSNNIAAPLWGARRIEELSQSDKNRAAVINLSKRFGMPSKYTSWFALPASEKVAFERQLLSYETERTIERWAQSVASGDQKRAKILRARAYDYRARLNKLTGQKENLPVETFKNALNAELDRVVAARETGGDKTKLSRLARNLRARGAVSYQEIADKQGRARERRRAVAAKANALYENYLDALQKGESTRAAQRLAQSDAAFKQSEKLGDSYDERPYLTRNRIANVATEIERERKAGIADSPRQQELLTQMRRLLPLVKGEENNFLSSAKTQLYNTDLEEFYRALALEVREGREAGIEAKRLRTNIEKIKSLVNSDNSFSRSWEVQNAYSNLASEQAAQYVRALEAGDQKKSEASLEHTKYLISQANEFARSGPYAHSVQLDQILAHSWSGVKTEATLDLAKEIAARRENSPAASAARARIKRAEANNASNYSYYDWTLYYAWKGRAHETAYRLLQARKNGDAELAKTLETQLEADVESARNATVGASDVPLDAYIEWEKSRIKRGEPLITSQDYVLRPGDPLISVAAPANCQKVIAILPSGELLPLVYDAAQKAWQARFDVPTYAGEGAYRVQILIVAADGARQQMTMNFAVDTSAPDGTGGAIFGADGLNLQLQTDEHTDRVSAFTPWNERIELRRDASGTFVARADVPANWQNKAAKVRFVLTDKAHNRTEIEVDWSR